MISFECDYNNGAHAKVLESLIKHNDVQTTPYGFDNFSQNAKEKIKAACNAPDAQVFFLTGGTQTNAVVIDSMLRKGEGVISLETGHINAHEAGAIEFSEHKVITLPSTDSTGKMKAEGLEKYLNAFAQDESNAHLVAPGLVYITLPTEFGGIYTARELEGIYSVCRRYDIPLYIDGARLGYGLAAEGCDITLPFLAQHCDAFYIGGTKVGALCGEAVVFTHNNAYKRFFSIQKQHGAVIAKGRLIGLQFDALFTDNLYMEIAKNAIEKAMKMKELLRKKEYEFYTDSPTNQQFVVLDNTEVERLSAKIGFSIWEKLDGNRTVCRFVTSWATTDDDLQKLESALFG